MDSPISWGILTFLVFFLIIKIIIKSYYESNPKTKYKNDSFFGV